MAEIIGTAAISDLCHRADWIGEGVWRRPSLPRPMSLGFASGDLHFGLYPKEERSSAQAALICIFLEPVGLSASPSDLEFVFSGARQCMYYKLGRSTDTVCPVVSLNMLPEFVLSRMQITNSTPLHRQILSPEDGSMA